MSIIDSNRYPYSEAGRYPYRDPPNGVPAWVVGSVVGLCIVVVVGLTTWDGLNASQIVRASTVPIHVEMTGFRTGAVLKPHPLPLAANRLH